MVRLHGVGEVPEHQDIHNQPLVPMFRCNLELELKVVLSPKSLPEHPLLECIQRAGVV